MIEFTMSIKIIWNILTLIKTVWKWKVSTLSYLHKDLLHTFELIIIGFQWMFSFEIWHVATPHLL